MAQSINIEMVERALQHRSAQPKSFKDSVASASLDYALEKRAAVIRLEPYARALEIVNKHITVRPEIIDAAVASYHEIGEQLVDKLDLPPDAISIFPQGSASTKTLIRAPGSGKFDIDAVCSIKLIRNYANNPIGFFEEIGQALDGHVVDKKNRCWQITFSDERFYIEFTPSVPLDMVAIEPNGADRRRLLVPQYRDTALAVVDRETEKWKTSNPQGLVRWVDEAAKIQLSRTTAMESVALSASFDSIEGVPKQEIEIDETLRIAIRLFKRHRDICVRRGRFDAKVQPISVILVTLMTRCYYGLAEMGKSYPNHVALMAEIATLLPHLMIASPDYGYYLGNPTVEGENFAERWNGDNGVRAQTFATWSRMLERDLLSILSLTDESEIEAKARDVFGCPRDSGPPSGNGGGGIPAIPTRRPPPAVPRTPGLA